MKLDPIDFLFSGIALFAALLTIYGFIIESEYKIICIPLGIILLGIYIWWYIKKYISKNFDDQEITIQKMNNQIQKVREEIGFIKGWIDAINHNKKGVINPIALIVIVIIAIIIILYLQGKL